MLASCSGGERAPDFTLRDDSGSEWTLSHQSGTAVLLTFGFTRCADTCPATLAKLVRLVAAMPGRSRDVEIAFVTVDPSHDSVVVLHRYLSRFDEDGIAPVGLTGTSAQIEHVKAAYHVWSQATAHEVAHSAAIFFIDPRGRLRGVHDDDDSATALSRAVAEMLPS